MIDGESFVSVMLTFHGGVLQWSDHILHVTAGDLHAITSRDGRDCD